MSTIYALPQPHVNRAPIQTALTRFEPEDLGNGLMVLATAGYAAVIEDIDPELHGIWIVVAAPAGRCSQKTFFDRLWDLIEPVGGWVAEAGSSICATNAARAIADSLDTRR